jgi:CBS domain-containing protein
MLKAKDIMTEVVIGVKKDTPIFHALELLAEHNVTGLPVAEDDGTLIGILSERDVLKLFHGSEDAENDTVAEHMSQPAIFFEADESLSDVCDCLAENYFRRVPVTSQGKLIGIVSRRDMIKEILKARDASEAVC